MRKMLIPQCPWRGEIKTLLPRHNCRIHRYHNALGGARSKLVVLPFRVIQPDTTMPLEGRDQNALAASASDLSMIPQCPWRGEIKTVGRQLGDVRLRYHNALGGARSKPGDSRPRCALEDTTMPLEGRDQNTSRGTTTPRFAIPQCPWRGEIKTKFIMRTCNSPGYHNALGGARSKLVAKRHPVAKHDTTMPLEGRDQNVWLNPRHKEDAIPQCPWRGEIKTYRPIRPRRLLGYHNALGGARSKPG